jgi:hypothetical protein
MPLSALEASRLDVAKSAAKLHIELQPMGEVSGWGYRYNFDGVLVYATIQKSYVQIFRAGTIEATDGETLQPAFAEYKNLIPSTAVEQYLILAVGRYLSAQKKLQLTPPIFVAITLMGVKNFAMATRFPVFQTHKIERDLLPLPEIMVEDYTVDVSQALRPTFDALWQASGFEGSPNYDQHGTWKPPSIAAIISSRAFCL